MSDPTEEMIRAEIAKARKILREDGFIVHAKSVDERLARMEAHITKGASPDPATVEPKTEPKADDGTTPPEPPPAKETPNDPNKSKKKSLWWGDAV